MTRPSLNDYNFSSLELGQTVTIFRAARSRNSTMKAVLRRAVVSKITQTSVTVTYEGKEGTERFSKSGFQWGTTDYHSFRPAMRMLLGDYLDEMLAEEDERLAAAQDRAAWGARREQISSYDNITESTVETLERMLEIAKARVAS